MDTVYSVFAVQIKFTCEMNVGDRITNVTRYYTIDRREQPLHNIFSVSRGLFFIG